MAKIYGYCRVSSPKQNIDRQIRNIKRVYPDVHIVQETFIKLLKCKKTFTNDEHARNWLIRVTM